MMGVVLRGVQVSHGDDYQICRQDRDLVCGVHLTNCSPEINNLYDVWIECTAPLEGFVARERQGSCAFLPQNVPALCADIVYTLFFASINSLHDAFSTIIASLKGRKGVYSRM